jgi:hypothetical protein
MGINATFQATTSYTGAGIAQGGEPPFGDTSTTTPPNTNAPMFGSIELGAGGTTQIPVPSVASGLAFTRVHMMPVGAAPSTNAKTLKFNLADAGSAVWTTGSVVLPIAPGGSLYVSSTTLEQIGYAFS